MLLLQLYTLYSILQTLYFFTNQGTGEHNLNIILVIINTYFTPLILKSYLYPYCRWMYQHQLLPNALHEAHNQSILYHYNQDINQSVLVICCNLNSPIMDCITPLWLNIMKDLVMIFPHLQFVICPSKGTQCQVLLFSG